MKKHLSTASAIFLAAVFLYAGIDKILHYDGFINALSSYVVVPSALAGALAPAVIAAEIWIGLGLLYRPWRGRAALTGAVTLVLFTIALGVNQVMAPGAVCGCWFTLTLAESTGSHIAQNLVLIGLAMTLWLELRHGLEDTADPTPSPAH